MGEKREQKIVSWLTEPGTKSVLLLLSRGSHRKGELDEKFNLEQLAEQKLISRKVPRHLSFNTFKKWVREGWGWGIEKCVFRGASGRDEIRFLYRHCVWQNSAKCLQGHY